MFLHCAIVMGCLSALLSRRAGCCTIFSSLSRGVRFDESIRILQVVPLFNQFAWVWGAYGIPPMLALTILKGVVMLKDNPRRSRFVKE